jgi:hypothetical protein
VGTSAVVQVLANVAVETQHLKAIGKPVLLQKLVELLSAEPATTVKGSMLVAPVVDVI